MISVRYMRSSWYVLKTVIAGDKRSPQPILGQRHSMNCIAIFFPNLFIFLGCPCCTDYYAWYLAAKALVLSLRSVWCHGNHVNARASNAILIITFDNSGSIQVQKNCTKWETFWFALLAWNLSLLRKIKVDRDLSLVRDTLSLRYEC